MMDIVRYTPPSTNGKGAPLAADTGTRTAIIVGRGRKWLHLLWMESGPLSVRKVPLEEERWMKPLLYRGAPYPLGRALTVYKRHAKAFGASPRALALLKEIGR